MIPNSHRHESMKLSKSVCRKFQSVSDGLLVMHVYLDLDLIFNKIEAHEQILKQKEAIITMKPN